MLAHCRTLIKAKVELDRNIARIYVILHCDHFSIFSKGTNCEITTRDQCAHRVVISQSVPLLRMLKWL